MRSLFLFCVLCLFAYAHVSAQQYNILDFGAKTDTTFLNTRAIQAAIDQCHAKGGGEVIVPAGRYFTGTILLKSNVYLNLLPGAVLQGSYAPEDYADYTIRDAQKFGTITHNGLYVESMKALVIADKAIRTGITGAGTIRGAGDGKAFQLGINKDGRPKNLFFIGCTDVLLKGVQVLNSAQITISISGCERVNIDGIYLRSMTNWNCDGIDVDARDATISNCMIDAEDDALCFKSEYLGKLCENITVPIGVSVEMAKTFPVSPAENVKGYPENRLTFGTRLPASGFHIRHAKGVTLADISLNFPVEEARPAFVMDDAERIDLKDIRLNGERRRNKKGMIREIASTDISVN
ncbi:hypothetical protein GCM10010967_23970 [Dyadobacter beijingensis]|uniref:Glycoside hydrolase family 28 protein n=1 Tax=Dyadobacter beijingensis TaxID=365489 RepID=A0ABQ2HUN0_9BACT|nr:glycosyl hydrolase family 28 protein [Dyadobacter beijingensis]GGM90226.1 hypothetical protein GCM10010967_23970 [Dyadobacter beijingensis]